MIFRHVRQRPDGPETIQPERPDAHGQRPEDVGEPAVAHQHGCFGPTAEALQSHFKNSRSRLGHAHFFRRDEGIHERSHSQKSQLSHLLNRAVIGHYSNAVMWFQRPQQRQGARHRLAQQRVMGLIGAGEIVDFGGRGRGPVRGEQPRVAPAPGFLQGALARQQLLVIFFQQVAVALVEYFKIEIR